MFSEGTDLHKVVLEEILQLSLGGRIGEVSDVQSPSLSGARDDSLILGCVDGLVTASSNAGALGSSRGLGEGGVGHLGSSRFNGHGVEVDGIDDTKCTGFVFAFVLSTSAVEVLRVRVDGTVGVLGGPWRKRVVEL